MSALFRRLLVANRGEIALRVIRTAREMGIETVAVYSDVDRNALHVRRADYAVRIGPGEPSASYLVMDSIIEAATDLGCDAIHPGYGFLSENPEFAEACAAAKIEFVGPPPDAIRLMGDKVAARKAASAASLSPVPGLEEELPDDSKLLAAARKVGMPVMLKAVAGGGGKGIRIVGDEGGLAEAAALARAEARAAFGDDRIYLEKYLDRPRHVEIQILADRHGGVVHYGERECSVQRRHQKLVEESPSPLLGEELRQEMGKAATELASEVGYVGAGTVEFLIAGGAFYFLEMNTRLQVEHPVTEMLYGVDLVREQLRMAAGEKLAPVGEPRGHAIEIRINAEDPDTSFPSLGVVTRLNVPGGPGVRLDSALYRGLEVTAHYDSMLAKLIVHALDRPQAIARALRALRELRTVGIITSVPLAIRVLESQQFVSGDYDTGILEKVNSDRPVELEELAALAAATHRFTRSERVSEGTAQDGNSGKSLTPWALIERVQRLGRKPR
jgi:acetyl-CoA carboxylase biotin carboxylase subunit